MDLSERNLDTFITERESDLRKEAYKFSKLSKEKKAEIAPQVLAEYYRQDFFLFAKFGLGYKDMNWETHKESVEVLESESARKILVLPRGSFKSSLACVAYPMWRLERNPNLTILLDSELYMNSRNFLREIKGHYASSKFIKIFGNRVSPTKWGESEIVLQSRNKNIKEASITVGGIGTTKVGQHYDLIIGDDYNSNKNSDTPEKCQKVIDHVRYNLNILNPGGEYVFIGTRYAERDVLGFLFSEVLQEKYLAEGILKLDTLKDEVKDESIY